MKWIELAEGMFPDLCKSCSRGQGWVQTSKISSHTDKNVTKKTLKEITVHHQEEEDVSSIYNSIICFKS